jgi:hypothetical protein
LNENLIMNCVDVPNRSAEEIRTKLSRENDMYLTTPRRDGCTLIISLIQETKSSSSPALTSQVGLATMESSRHVLAALRSSSSVPLQRIVSLDISTLREH